MKDSVITPSFQRLLDRQSAATKAAMIVPIHAPRHQATSVAALEACGEEIARAMSEEAVRAIHDAAAEAVAAAERAVEVLNEYASGEASAIGRTIRGQMLIGAGHFRSVRDAIEYLVRLKARAVAATQEQDFQTTTKTTEQ